MCLIQIFIYENKCIEWAFLRGVFKIIAWCKFYCQRLENNEYVIYDRACCTTETAIAGIFSSVVDFVLTKSHLHGLTVTRKMDPKLYISGIFSIDSLIQAT